MYVGVGQGNGRLAESDQTTARFEGAQWHVPCRARVAGNPSTCGGDMDPWIHHGRENIGAAWAVQ